jgi:hypothetical protein
MPGRLTGGAVYSRAASFKIGPQNRNALAWASDSEIIVR